MNSHVLFNSSRKRDPETTLEAKEEADRWPGRKQEGVFQEEGRCDRRPPGFTSSKPRMAC